MGDDLGDMAQRAQLKIRKNDRERSIWGVGSLAEKVFRPLRGSKTLWLPCRENVRVQVRT